MEGHCTNCGLSINALFALALMQHAGAKVYPSATKCSSGVEHTLTFKETKND